MWHDMLQALAEMVTDEHLAEGRVYPPLSSIVDVSTCLSTRIMEYAYKQQKAGRYPEPKDKEAFVRNNQYSHEYVSYLPELYPWPQWTLPTFSSPVAEYCADLFGHDSGD